PAPMSATRLELLRRVQRFNPADLWANHALAFELDASGKPKEAIIYYTAALALRPESAGLYLNRGKAYYNAGDFVAAIADSRQAVALAPEYAAARHNLGRTLLDNGQLDDAIVEYQEVVRIENTAEAHYNLANCLREKRMLDKAIEEYRHAI